MQERKVFRILEMLFSKNIEVKNFLNEAIRKNVRVKKTVFKSGIKKYETAEDMSGLSKSILLKKNGSLIKKTERFTNENHETLELVEDKVRTAPATIIVEKPDSFIERVINGGAIFAKKRSKLCENVTVINPSQNPKRNTVVAHFDLIEHHFLDKSQRPMGTMHKPFYRSAEENSYIRLLDTKSKSGLSI